MEVFVSTGQVLRTEANVGKSFMGRSLQEIWTLGFSSSSTKNGIDTVKILTERYLKFNFCS